MASETTVTRYPTSTAPATTAGVVTNLYAYGISTMSVPTREEGEGVHSRTPAQNANYYIWDCTEPVATRPLAWLRADSAAYYIRDGNKNVSEVIAADGEITAHYEYAPFGAVSAQRGTFATLNPWRFSSEFSDDELWCDYYNYREYEPMTGRWMQSDPKMYGKNINGMVDNNTLILTDSLGLEFVVTNHVAGETSPIGWRSDTAQTIMTKIVDISIEPTAKGCTQGCYKFAVVFPKIRVDVYYKDEYHRIQSFPDEMQHVECYKEWHKKLTEIANVAKGMACMSLEAVNAAVDGFINETEVAADECDRCNNELDKSGGAHGH